MKRIITKADTKFNATAKVKSAKETKDARGKEVKYCNATSEVDDLLFSRVQFTGQMILKGKDGGLIVFQNCSLYNMPDFILINN